MTMVNPRYRDEIFGLITRAGHPVLHVFLDVPADELRRRIDAQVLDEDNPERDAEARAFRHRNVECCVAARAALPADTSCCAATSTRRLNSSASSLRHSALWATRKEAAPESGAASKPDGL